MLPIGVVLPTKNSAAYLPQHIASMESWIELVEEIVVVDSFSTDGTSEFLRSKLHHNRVTFLIHPPGLYQSWNHGIGHISAPYVYISSIGDTITREGLEKLSRAAEDFKADVVLSKPDFYSPEGEALPDICWPIDDIISALGITEPRRLKKLEAVLFALTSTGGAMTGSCASDLFRTAVLKRFPFPSDFGVAGDGAWGIQHAAEVNWAVVPERFSRFLRHPAVRADAELKSYEQAPSMAQFALQSIARAKNSGALSSEDCAVLNLDDILNALSDYQMHKAAYDAYRKSALPWALNPAAWLNRLRRNQAAERLRELKQKALRIK